MDRDMLVELANKRLQASHYKGPHSTVIADQVAGFLDRFEAVGVIEINDLVDRMVVASLNVQSPPSLTPDVLLTSDYLAEKVTPWVELVRTELFGAVRPPFDNLKGGEDWLLSHWDGRIPQAKERLDAPDIYRTLFFHVDRPIGINGVFILEPPPPLWTVFQLRARASDYSPLNWLEREVMLMCEATGFTQPAVVEFVLIGTRPLVARYYVHASPFHRPIPPTPEFKSARYLGDELLRRSYVDIHIEAHDLTFEELRQIYSEYREVL